MGEEEILAAELWEHLQAQRPDLYEPNGRSGEAPVDIAICLGGADTYGLTIPPSFLRRIERCYARRDDFDARQVNRQLALTLQAILPEQN